MRFGGHETFQIREGWLNKGLRTLIENPELLAEDNFADRLGVGRNMGKSIKHWLTATGLADLVPAPNSPKKKRLQVNDLGKIIFEYDPYFMENGTWWALHVNLVNNPDFAYSWNWFFNIFNLIRFERAVCLEGLRQQLQFQRNNMPAIKTLQRDLNCLLGSYAKRIPNEEEDPEDASYCPFIGLNLMSYYPSSGFYVLNNGIKKIHRELIGYSLAICSDNFSKGHEFVDVSIRDAAQIAGGPGRCFVLSNETFFDIIQSIEDSGYNQDFNLSGSAGERLLRIRCKESFQWMKEFYQNNIN